MSDWPEDWEWAEDGAVEVPVTDRPDGSHKRNRSRWARYVRVLQAKRRDPLVRRALALIGQGDADIGGWLAPGGELHVDRDRLRAYEAASDIVWLTTSDARVRLNQLDLGHLVGDLV